MKTFQNRNKFNLKLRGISAIKFVSGEKYVNYREVSKLKKHLKKFMDCWGISLLTANVTKSGKIEVHGGRNVGINEPTILRDYFYLED